MILDALIALFGESVCVHWQNRRADPGAFREVDRAYERAYTQASRPAKEA